MTVPTEERYTGLAREIRILLMSTLGSWSKVLQLVMLLLVLATSLSILIAVTRASGQPSFQCPTASTSRAWCSSVSPVHRG